MQKRVCNVYTYSDWASILHTTVGGWVGLAVRGDLVSPSEQKK